ncbi:hypothetical protein [Agathobacter ruminis]|uniref:Uncharacterized protein n=1 Tax=Agathobacter ruminis TaxID=1712665 RepID=A0A2G3E2K1_9FIRM|nr:hypothetical protein [Agathobacter ruminis]MDC7300292.1 hypothetical protein [Agathobacter ruminis]PHU37380.1 hypothetical protein CSX02_08280 [Agathobacter ruminis]
MLEIKRELEKQIKKLEAAIQKAESDIKKSPEGSLRIQKRAKTVAFYWVKNEKEDQHHVGKYIRKENWQMVPILAQKGYAAKLIRKMQLQLDLLKQFEKQYNPNLIIHEWEQLPELRKNWVRPYEMTDDEYAKQWIEEPYERKTQPTGPIHTTTNGETVRSKSEVLIAERLCHFGVPYRYEQRYYLKGMGNVHPDFTLLNKKTRKVYIWEHFGRVDDAAYWDYNIQKIECYVTNGYYPGESLLMTFESLNHPITTQIIDSMIKRYLL